MAEYENILFWAGTFRHVSCLEHSLQNFDSVIGTWFDSPEATSLFNHDSTSGNGAIST